MELREIAEKSEYLEKPKDHSNYNNAIEDSFDLPLHGDKAVDEPHHDANDNKGENHSDQGHLLFSNRGIEADLSASMNGMRFPWIVSFSASETSVPETQSAKRIRSDGAGFAQQPMRKAGAIALLQLDHCKSAGATLSYIAPWPRNGKQAASKPD